MKTILMIALVLGLGAAHADEWSKEIFEFAARATDKNSLMAGEPRAAVCGGPALVSQDAKNAAFAACVMYVLGAVDMLWEWQKIDPTHAPAVCIPRAMRAGDLIIAIQEHVEATQPSHWQQYDAAPAVIAALAAKWPCGRRQ
jgi:hypothetical protein